MRIEDWKSDKNTFITHIFISIITVNIIIGIITVNTSLA